MIGNLIAVPPPIQLVSTVNQSIAAGVTISHGIALPCFASASSAFVINTTTLGGSTAGYPGIACNLRPGIGLGRASSIEIAGYPGAFCTSLITRLSDPIYGGFTIYLEDAWIDNASGLLVFRFRNGGGSIATCGARINALVWP
jgi:hypothetical protein